MRKGKTRELKRSARNGTTKVKRKTTYLVESRDLTEHGILSSLHDGMVQHLLSDSLSLHLRLVGSVGSLDFSRLGCVGSLLGACRSDSVGRWSGGRGGGGRSRVNDLRSVGSRSSRVVDGLRVGSLGGIHLRGAEKELGGREGRRDSLGEL